MSVTAMAEFYRAQSLTTSPSGRVVRSILDAVGATPNRSDVDLPGRSLIGLANSADENRIAFLEYYAIFSPSGVCMVRNERFKYVHYVGYAPQLFDLVADPDVNVLIQRARSRSPGARAPRSTNAGWGVGAQGFIAHELLARGCFAAALALDHAGAASLLSVS